MPGGASSAWMQGFHGALVHVEEIPATALRELAMAHRSTGLGRMAVLVDLPDAPQARSRPRRSLGARGVSRGGPVEGVAATPATAPSPRPAPEMATPQVGAVPLVGAPAEPAAAGGTACVGSAHARPDLRPSADPDPDDGCSLAAWLDRRLPEARFLLLPNRSRAYAAGKRFLDLVIGLTLLVLFSPVILALAVLIRLDSPGPAIFRQDRVTRGGRIFCFYKFRTMVVDARERFPELYDYRLDRADFESAYYKLADDPRSTRVGRWLRRTTLDELPNLVNVVKGDISLVGPRPDLPELVRLYRPEELCCLFTKAGLTGVAQVAGRSLLTVRERLTLDMRYVAQQTLLLDLRILWRTVVIVLSGRGAF